MNNWRGVGTALLLAEQGHQVAVATAAPVLARGLEASAADAPLRKRFARAGGEAITEVILLAWEGATARFRNLLDNREWERHFDGLVLATLPEPETTLQSALIDSGLEVHAIGDCVVPRRASLAFYEGRKLGMAL